MTSIFNWFGGILGYLLWFFYTLIHNYGIAILLFTIVTKIILFPFSIKQQKSMAANSKMAAKQKEIQKRYANDKMKMQEEMQKLYDQEGVSPASGCLPMLLPFPIMIGIYYTVLYPLQNALHIGIDSINKATTLLSQIPGVGTTFNSMYGQMEIIKHFDQLRPHLTMFTGDELDRIASLSSGFNFLGLNLLDTPQSSGFFSFMWLIPVLCLATSLISQVAMTKMQPGMDQQQGCMKATLYIMPLFSAWIAYTLPGAVGFYWIIQTVVSFVQTLVLRKFYSPALIGAKAEAQRIALREQEEARIPRLSVPMKIASGAPTKQQANKKEKALPQQSQGQKPKGKSKQKSDDYRGTKK